MLAVTGYNSRIVQELIEIVPGDDQIPAIMSMERPDDTPIVTRYVLCAGVLRSKPLSEQSLDEITESVLVNGIWPMQLCDRILHYNDHARICIIGSESGYTWSHDGTYAAAKAALHRYVETKKLKPGQQLVCVAPSIVGDAGMTLRRTDTENLDRRRQENPKRRFLKAVEVARMVHFLLYVDEGYTTGTVIRMNGGC